MESAGSPSRLRGRRFRRSDDRVRILFGFCGGRRSRRGQRPCAANCRRGCNRRRDAGFPLFRRGAAKAQARPLWGNACSLLVWSLQSGPIEEGSDQTRSDEVQTGQGLATTETGQGLRPDKVWPRPNVGEHGTGFTARGHPTRIWPELPTRSGQYGIPTRSGQYGIPGLYGIPGYPQGLATTRSRCCRQGVATTPGLPTRCGHCALLPSAGSEPEREVGTLPRSRVGSSTIASFWAASFSPLPR